ncbi:serine/arginine-rich splicing factor SR45-like [Iris pallida]|uniref:Serine/arginine-rich splicing factor SR45-like n=1 Tax=Iris pallida TaxID=29817 RepID=A0AAX6DRI1_IRIPA|nr:serine/arginine-rich splicing factor SR45-like [Iris pallida]
MAPRDPKGRHVIRSSVMQSRRSDPVVGEEARAVVISGRRADGGVGAARTSVTPVSSAVARGGALLGTRRCSAERPERKEKERKCVKRE